jgi:hypothetical protein
MRLQIDVDGAAYWIDVKESWTRRDIRMWWDALGQSGPEGEAAQLALLEKWSTGCHLVDQDGVVYDQVSALSSEALDNLDAAQMRLVFTAPSAAYEQRASLGNVKRGGLS